MTAESKRAQPKSVSVCSITTSAARCGAATASSRQMPTVATPAVATCWWTDLEFGAGAMG